MNDNDIIESGINMIINGELNKAHDSYMNYFRNNQSLQLKHNIIIIKILIGNVNSAIEFLKDLLLNNSERSLIVINSFLKKNSDILKNTKNPQILYLIAILLNKLGFISESKDYLKVSHLISSNNFKTMSLMGELLIKEKKYEQGIKYLADAALLEFE